MNYVLIRSGLCAAGLLLVLACEDSGKDSPVHGSAGSAGSACTTGDEECVCYPNATCNGALLCVSSVCVRATSTGDAGSAGTSAAANAAGSDGEPAQGGTANGGDGNGGVGNAGWSDGGGSLDGGSSNSIGGALGIGGKPSIDPKLLLIDGFGDCDEKIEPLDGRDGSWAPLSGTKEFKVGKPPNSSWLNQTCGVWATGSCSSCSEMGLGVSLSSQSYDLSKFSGMRVTYESTSTIMLRIRAKNNESHSYATTAAIPPGGPESVATVLFDKFAPNPNFDGIDKADAIQIIIADSGLYGIGVHKLELLP